MPLASLETMRLSRFQWNPEKRPSGIQELFLYEPAEITPVQEKGKVDPMSPATKSGKRKGK
jgi:hypothetical protein